MSKIKHWFVTGDTHGLVNNRLSNIDTQKYNPEETAVIILGDAGINFYLNKTDLKNKKWINNTGFTIYCVRGNHEERPEKVPGIHPYIDDEVGGVVLQEVQFPNIRYLMDGGEYNIDGKSVLVIGGAYSVDKWYRLHRAGVYNKLDPNYSNSKRTGWFPAELLTEEEMDMIGFKCRSNWYDIVLTHTCPESWEPTDLFLPGLDQSTVDKSMEKWLDWLKDEMDWAVWLFGHYHDDRLVRPGVEMYYKDIEELSVIWDRWQHPDQLDWWLKKDPNYEAGL